MTRWLAPLCLAAGLIVSLPAAAQLGGLPLPEVPSVGGVLDQLPEVDVSIDAEALREARRLRVRELLRAHRRELERDPRGDPIVRSQIIALGMDRAAVQEAERRGFSVARRDGLDGAGEMVTLRAPANIATRRALRLLREADPDGVYDFDHLHLESGLVQDRERVRVSVRTGRARIGLIDGGVGPGLRNALAGERSFAGDGAASAHGAAVATILLQTAPDARLYAADVYGGAPTGGASSALARALAWLSSEGVPVINVSLVGPRNRIVEAVVARAITAGHVIVAAVGNDGPAARPLYPSAYPGVVGVTGVDARGRVLVEAGRGAHVDFASPGILEIEGRRLRGTSYAAPVVAGLLAVRISAPSADGAERALQALRAEARDLGARGRDDVYGYGLVGAGARLAASE
jgi:subtilisin family serine protease